MNGRGNRDGRLGRGRDRPFLRSFTDPVTIVLVALSCVGAVWGGLHTAAHPEDESALLAFALFGTATVPTAWAVTRVLWSEDPRAAIIIALVRAVITPPVFTIPPVIAMSVTVMLPDVRSRIEQTRRPDGWRYFFGGDEDSILAQALGQGYLAGVFFSMLAALVMSVFVVLPVLAWFRPVAAAQSNLLRTRTAAERRAAASGIRILSVILMMTFGVPALILFGSSTAVAGSVWEVFITAPRVFADLDYLGDAAWAVGVLAVPVGVLLVVWLKRVQRPDVAARAALGVNAADDIPARRDPRDGGDPPAATDAPAAE